MEHDDVILNIRRHMEILKNKHGANDKLIRDLHERIQEISQENEEIHKHFNNLLKAESAIEAAVTYIKNFQDQSPADS